MRPKKPVLWLIGFSMLFLLIDHYYIGNDLSFSGSIMVAFLTGIVVLGFMYGLDTVLYDR